MNRSTSLTIRFITLTIISLLLLFIFSCKKDPTGPTAPTDTYTLEETKTIGADGGTIELTDFLLSVPSGAFNSDNEIGVYTSSIDKPFGSNNVSRSIKLSGIPTDFSKPLKIKIKYTGQLTNKSYLAIGNSQTDEVNGDSTIVYDLFTASDSSGYLVSELPVIEYSGLGKIPSLYQDGLNNLSTSAVSGYDVRNMQHFTIKYPNVVESKISEIGNIFEEVFQIVTEELGLKLALEHIPWKVIINNNIVRYVVLGEVFYGLIFDVSQKHINDSAFSEIKLAAGKEMINEMVYYFYFGNDYRYDELDWLHEAINAWVEELLTSDPGFKNPQNFPKNTYEPFNSIEVEANVDTITHGIGMSSVIKYLTDDSRFGKAGIRNMYEYISEHHPDKSTQALLQTMTAPLTEWWPDFFKKYVSGEIYDVPIDFFLEKAKGEWDINSIEDTLKVFSSTEFSIGEYLDLSAKMFKINLNYEPPDTSYKMLFNMTGEDGTPDDLALVVFGIDASGNAKYLGTANEQDFEILNLKDFIDVDGIKQFLVVLVNSNIISNDYLGKYNVDLTVKVQKQDYNVCNAIMAIPIEVRTYFADTEQESFNTTGLPNYNPKAVGSFDGNTWTGSFNEGGWTGQLVATLNDDRTMVTNMDFMYYYNDENNNGTMGYSFTNIPIHPWDPGLYTLHYNDDPTLCSSHVSNVVYSWQSGSVSRTLHSGPICDNNSWAYIRFGNE